MLNKYYLLKNILLELSKNVSFLVLECILNYIHTDNPATLKLKDNNVVQILMAADYLR
jgi:hypothetical protein